jgi:CRP-like cAMP-binding protein
MNPAAFPGAEGLIAAIPDALAGLVPDREIRAALLRYGHRRALREGRPLSLQGEEAAEAFLVCAGRLRRVKYRSDESLTPLPGMAPGDWCGLPELLSGGAYLADAVAEEPCAVLAFGRANLRLLGDACPAFRADFLPLLLARELVALHNQLADAGPLDRIVAWLLGRRRQVGQLVNAGVAVSQAELGMAVGCTRETVNKHLGMLQARGLIRVGRRSIEIPDWEALARYQ